jgi:hypothetical protein
VSELRPVLAGVFDAFSGGLRTWALLLAGMGLVLAAAASSFASHVEIEEVASRCGTGCARPARSFRASWCAPRSCSGAACSARCARPGRCGR